MDGLPSVERARAAWWTLVLALGAAFAFVLYSFVGTFVLGLFAYYGMRPLDRRVKRILGDRRLTAIVTLFGLLLPFIAVLVLVGFKALREAAVIAGETQFVQEFLTTYLNVASFSELEQRLVSSLLENPREVLGVDSGTIGGSVSTGLRILGAAATGILHVFLALTLAYFLLRDDTRFAAWFRERIGGEGTTAYAYARTVDADLETIYSGNILTLLVVAVIAGVVYNGFNLIAPSALTIPLPTVMAVLTGAASLVPIVVGKLVYVPVTVYVGVRAFQVDAGFGFPIALALVSLVALDLVPQMVVRPYLSGRDSHMGLVLFAYVLGTLLFGWYGLFLGPLLLVLMVQAVRLVVPELVKGEPVKPDVRGAEDFGVSPSDLGLEEPDREGSDGENESDGSQ